MSNETLPPETLKARLIRAASGLSQAQMSEKTGIDPAQLARIETGDAPVSEDQLQRMAAEAGIGISEAEELLALYEEQTRSWMRTSEDLDAVIEEISRGLRRYIERAVRRLLKLLPPPQPADVEEQLARLRRLSARSRLTVVQSVETYRTPALARGCREEARRHPAGSRRAASWHRLADEIE